MVRTMLEREVFTVVFVRQREIAITWDESWAYICSHFTKGDKAITSYCKSSVFSSTVLFTCIFSFTSRVSAGPLPPSPIPPSPPQLHYLILPFFSPCLTLFLYLLSHSFFLFRLLYVFNQNITLNFSPDHLPSSICERRRWSKVHVRAWFTLQKPINCELSTQDT